MQYRYSKSARRSPICAPSGPSSFKHLLRKFLLATEDSLERPPVLDTHQVVEDGVERGGEVVEAAGDVEEVLVDCPKRVAVFEVDIAESLDVKWSPGNEERNDDTN